jgi:hypothetical protein
VPGSVEGIRLQLEGMGHLLQDNRLPWLGIGDRTSLGWISADAADKCFGDECPPCGRRSEST